MGWPGEARRRGGRSRRGRPEAAERGSSVRKQLVDAMAQEAGIRGLRGTSVESVAARAGASAAEFERHFRNLEECFLAAWDEINEEFLNRCVGAYSAPESWRQQMRAMASAVAEFLATEPVRSRTLFCDLLEAGPKGVARRDLYVGVFAAIIDEGRAELAEPASIPYEVARGIAASTYELIHLQMSSATPLPPTTLMSELLFMAMTPYVGVEAAMEELARPLGGGASCPVQARIAEFPDRLRGSRLCLWPRPSRS